MKYKSCELKFTNSTSNTSIIKLFEEKSWKRNNSFCISFSFLFIETSSVHVCTCSVFCCPKKKYVFLTEEPCVLKKQTWKLARKQEKFFFSCVCLFQVFELFQAYFVILTKTKEFSIFHFALFFLLWLFLVPLCLFLCARFPKQTYYFFLNWKHWKALKTGIFCFSWFLKEDVCFFLVEQNSIALCY